MSRALPVPLHERRAASGPLEGDRSPRLTPAEAAQLTSSRVLALVTDSGSASSHTAILARALQIPAVVGVETATRRLQTGQLVEVDGIAGTVTVLPD